MYFEIIKAHEGSIMLLQRTYNIMSSGMGGMVGSSKYGKHFILIVETGGRCSF